MDSVEAGGSFRPVTGEAERSLKICGPMSKKERNNGHDVDGQKIHKGRR
jgi:hypothetical protein